MKLVTVNPELSALVTFFFSSHGMADPLQSHDDDMAYGKAGDTVRPSSGWECRAIQT